MRHLKVISANGRSQIYEVQENGLAQITHWADTDKLLAIVREQAPLEALPPHFNFWGEEACQRVIDAADYIEHNRPPTPEEVQQLRDSGSITT